MNEKIEKTEEEVKEENRKMIRSCIIGIIVIILFTGVYFVFGGRGDEKSTVTPPASEQTAEPSETENPSKTEENAVEEVAPESAEIAEKSTGEKDTEAAEADDIYAKYDIKYTQQQALEIAREAAKKQFGENAFVVPASEETPAEVEINGKNRPCYMFGADDLANLTGENASMRGLYHFDAETGEIFNNENGEMKKIN